MVQLSAAVAVQNATFVELEDRSVGLDGNRDRLLCDSLHEGLLVVGSDILVASDTMTGDANLAPLGVAVAILARVWIAALGADSCSLFVLEAIVHQPSAAAFIAFRTGAIHELLL